MTDQRPNVRYVPSTNPHQTLGDSNGRKCQSVENMISPVGSPHTGQCHLGIISKGAGALPAPHFQVGFHPLPSAALIFAIGACNSINRTLWRESSSAFSCDSTSFHNSR